MTRPQDHIAAMSSYALADMTIPAGKTPVSLAQNECLRGPGPQVVAAMQAALARTELYPDPDWSALRQSLARVYGIDAAGILCGNGSLDLIASIATAYGGAERAVLAPAHAYPFFGSAARMSGARFDTAPEDDLTVSVDALLEHVRPETSLVFLANPGNPTGTCLPDSEIARLRARLRRDVLLIVDEAYGEFTERPLGSCWKLVDKGDTAVLRTFSKAYALAGLRVGWGLFPSAVADTLRKVLRPNALTSVSQAAAGAALADQTYVRQTCEITARARGTWRHRLVSAGFDVPLSHTNFLLIRFDDAQQARSADAFLRSEGIFLRGQGAAGLPECLRMTIGQDSAMLQAVTSLERWKGEERP